jgi:hypothetical protein
MLSHPPGRQTLEALDQDRERQVRRIRHEEVNVVRLTVGLQEGGPDILADHQPLGVDRLEHPLCKDGTPVLRREHEVRVQAEDRVSGGAEVLGCGHFVNVIRQRPVPLGVDIVGHPARLILEGNGWTIASADGARSACRKISRARLSAHLVCLIRRKGEAGLSALRPWQIGSSGLRRALDASL